MSTSLWLNAAIADSVASVGHAITRLLHDGSPAPRGAPPRADCAWSDQFAEPSLDDARGRRTVRALYRGATVRL